MYVRKELSDDIWRASFEKIAQEKGLRKLAIIATRMSQLYLGLSEDILWCKEADEQVCKRFMSIVMMSGNFGRKNGKGITVEYVSSSIRRNGFRYLQSSGEQTWKAYKKYSWLKPFAWIYQIFRYVCLGLKTKRSRKLISGDFIRSKERVKLLKKLDI